VIEYRVKGYSWLTEDGIISPEKMQDIASESASLESAQHWLNDEKATLYEALETERDHVIENAQAEGYKEGLEEGLSAFTKAIAQYDEKYQNINSEILSNVERHLLSFFDSVPDKAIFQTLLIETIKKLNTDSSIQCVINPSNVDITHELMKKLMHKFQQELGHFRSLEIIQDNNMGLDSFEIITKDSIYASSIRIHVGKIIQSLTQSSSSINGEYVGKHA